MLRVTLGDLELGPKTAGICLHCELSLLQVSVEACEHTLCAQHCAAEALRVPEHKATYMQ